MANEIFQREIVLVEDKLAVGRTPSETVLGLADFVAPSGDATINIISGTSDISIINFGNSDVNFDNATIEYHHTSGELHIEIAGGNRIIIDTSGTAEYEYWGTTSCKHTTDTNVATTNDPRTTKQKWLDNHY